MKLTRIMSVLMAIVLLAVCPGAAFARSDVANKTIDFWIDCIDYLAPSYGYSTEWYYSDSDDKGTSEYELLISREDSPDRGVYLVYFCDLDNERGVDLITISRSYSKYAFDTPAVPRQLVFIIRALYGISHMYTDPDLTGLAQIIADTLDCVTTGMDSPEGMMYMYCGSSVMIGVNGHSKEKDYTGVDIVLICDTGESSISGSLTMPSNFSLTDLYDGLS